MRIDRIDLFHVAMPLISPWRTAYGEDAEIHSILCRMESGSLTGWGESSALAAPCYSPEWAGGAFEVARKWMGPRLIGKDIPSGAELQNRLAMFKGNPFAKAAFDTAWWSLKSRLENQPLFQLLGGTRDHVPIGADFGVDDSIDRLVERIGAAVDQKFPRVKLKFRPGWDIPMLEAVWKEFPDKTFHIDCNSGYRLDDVSLFQRVDDFGLAMIEQPLAYDDLHDHSQLARQIQTPLCLDESINSPRKAATAISIGSCQFINIKPGRVGGITPALEIHELCQTAGIPCWIGGMLESAIGASFCVALGTLDNFTYPGDLFPSSRFYHRDLADPPLEITPLPDGTPGMRALLEQPEPHPDRLKQQTQQHRQILS